MRILLMRGRDRAISPVMGRFDAVEKALDVLSRRLDEIDALIQSLEGRVATVTERHSAHGETEARLARRVEEIEKLMAAPGSERR